MNEPDVSTFMHLTKFVPQQTRTALVERNRLLNKLTEENDVSFPLSLIVAPSGYGKSTLMAQFMSHYVQQGEVVCWLSLDESDNDEDTFITYLIESYRRSNSEYSATTNTIGYSHYPHINPQARLQQLLGSIEQSRELVKIILDDFQVLTSPSLLAHVTWLIQRSPRNLSFYIIAKSEPNLPIISELRVKNNLLEITANELNFTLQESRAFLSNKKNINLDDIEIQALHNKTEGWIAATQLLSLAIQNYDQTNKTYQKSFIESISGTDKDIVKYLGNYVFNFQNDNVKNFFISTAILQRFNADLCIAVCGQNSAANTLDYVSAQGLFIFELDRKRNWFRYHHLFREFLQGELNKQGVTKYQELTQRAAAWYEKQGYIEEAIDYYLLGKQFKKAAMLISDIVVEAVQYRGNHSVLLKWVERLPFKYMLETPKIAICYAWSLLFTRNFEQSDHVLEALADYSPILTNEQILIDYNIEMLSLIKGVISGDFNHVRQNIALWLDKWTDAPIFEQGVVLGLLGASCLHTLEYSLARKVLIQGKSIFEKIDCDYGLMWVDSLYALVHFKQGHLLESKRILKKALLHANEKMGEHSFGSSLINITLSQIYCDLNNNDAAHKYLSNGFSSIDKHGVIDTALIGFMIKSRLQYRQQAKNDAVTTLLQGESYGRNHNLSGFEVALVAERIRLFLRDDNYTFARDLFDERLYGEVDQDNVFHYTPFEIIQIMSLHVRMALADKRPQAALKIINSLSRLCKQKNYNQLNEHLLLLSASAHFDLEKKNQAFRILNQVIEAAAKEEKQGLFVDEQYHLKGLMIEFMTKVNLNTQCQRSDEQVIFIEQIRKIFGLEENKEVTPSADLLNSENMAHNDILTKRERELLVLLQQGLSNKELAESLFVSESTIKWHLSRIYIKLDAKNRVDAIKIYFDK